MHLLRTAMRRQSAKGAARARAWAKVTKQVIADNNGRCAVGAPDCSGFAEHGHHRLARSQGGPDIHANCLPVCASCHRWGHEHPAAAKALGFVLTRTMAVDMGIIPGVLKESS